MPILSEFRCQRCGQHMQKSDMPTQYCQACLARYTPEEWQRWATMRLDIPLCLYCGKSITGRAGSTVLSGRVKFCSTACHALAESKIPQADWPEIVRLYCEEQWSAGNIAQRYRCSSTTVLKVVSRFTTPRVGAQPGEKNHMFGKTHSPAARAKIREANHRQFSTPGARERHGEMTALQIQKGKTGKAFNKLEVAFAAILDGVGIAYQCQAKLGRYLFDFLLPETHTFIEVHGTFWHADPRIYDHAHLKPPQQRNVANDIRKEAAVLAAGFRLLVFWEYDIWNTPEAIKSQMLSVLPSGSEG